MIPEITPQLQQIEGISGVLMASVVAFIIVFILLAGICLYAIISLNRHVAVVMEKKESAQKAVSPEAVTAPVFAPAPVIQASSAKEMKKIVAAISAAINASVGRSMKIISVIPAQAQNMSPIWRVTGITECMDSRLSGDSGSRSGSRSW